MIYPPIIQGGMGAGVSGWTLARAVSSRGQIGVVSGTALDLILVRRLQTGDPGGHLRRALARFPNKCVTRRLIDRYFVEGGKSPEEPFLTKPMPGDKPNHELEELLIAANFVEVFLAKEGHDGLVGINYLNKIQTPLLPSLYGAMLAGVDIVLVGAGIPVEVPAVLDGLSRNETVTLNLHVHESISGHVHKLSFTPHESIAKNSPPLACPLFFPIVSSATLASLLVKKLPGQIDGIIVEESSAGGHNAPPRGRATFNSDGEPVYGPRDKIDLKAIQSLGLPFWLAGSYGNPEKLEEACANGATGVQVGTLFAFCEESGLRDDLKKDTRERCLKEIPRVFRDPVASPTGFPFQVLDVVGTLSDPGVYVRRGRQCDLGYLREGYERPEGPLGWRCPAEDPEEYVRKGGKIEETVGRKCLCNSLTANIGLAQIRSDNSVELPLVTCGHDLSGITRILRQKGSSYTAADVLDFLFGKNVATPSPAVAHNRPRVRGPFLG